MPNDDIADACKPLRNAWDDIKQDFIKAVPGHYLELDCVYRSAAIQNALYMKGRELSQNGLEWVVVDKNKVVTNVDGRINKGAHNYKPSRAIDVRVINNQTGKVSWDEDLYQPLILIAKKYNLESGGVWKTLKDYPHIQVPDFKNYKGD